MINESSSDCHLNFTVPNQGDTWKIGTGYRVTVSSYLNTDFSARNIFTGNGAKVWVQSLTNSYVFNGSTLAGYQQKCCRTSSPFDYIGPGSTGLFQTTVYNTNQSVNGEYVELKVPDTFRMKLSQVGIMPRDHASNAFRVNAPRYIYVLGSIDGSTWSSIGSGYYMMPDSYVVSAYNYINISTADLYHYIRIVVSSLNGATGGLLQFGSLQLNFDAYVLQ